MKILQIFGAVVAVHLLAFIFIFASPGCSSTPRNVPTPDATLPNASGSAAAISYNSTPAETVVPTGGYVPEGTPGRVSPTRPGSPNAAAITPAKATANVAPVASYTIQKGDSLWIIAKKNHISVAELTKANNLGSNPVLRPGKKLMIPGKPAPIAAPAENPLSFSTTPVAATPATVEAAPHPSAEVVKHVVANGESLGIIARKYGLTVGELAAANNITDPAKIRVGQPLVIPAGKGNRTAAKTSPKPTPAAPSVKRITTPTPAPAPTVDSSTAEPPAFQIKPPPAGQDLDAGLKENTSTDVPTIKVEEPKPEDAPKS